MNSESGDNLVLSLANEFVERYRRGERPDVSEYANQHPDLADEIRDVFPMMLLMEDNAPEEPKPIETSLDVDRLGDFLIRHEIGRGGMGVVYEAVQESLGRYVALKVCPISSRLDSRHQERFRRESRAAAMLHHTNIVPVFAVGEENGMLFYAMQYIRGATVEEVIGELRHMYKTNPTANSRLTGISRPMNSAQHSAVSEVALSLVGEIDPSLAASSASKAGSGISEISLPGQSVADSQSGGTARYWESVARIGVQVADALEYAHEQGTLHRDIKPSNLMLDQSGTVWVMDFGLAKSTEEHDLTQAGELIGTLRYMSPEQSTGNPDVRSDIYSLGLTLYELLALRPAFDELQRSALLRAISESDPVAPRKINPNVPRDLETIVMKAIDKEPARRYQTAAAIQADLNRYLQGEPILARPISSTERLSKWVRRRPIIAGLTSALALTLCLGFALVSWNWFRAESALEDAREASDRATHQQALAEERLEMGEDALYRSAIGRAGMLSRTDVQSAQTILAGLVPKEGETDRRGWEWGYLTELANPQVAVLQAGPVEAPWIWDLAFSADDSLLAIASGRTRFTKPETTSPDGRVSIWNVQQAKCIADLPIKGTGFAVAFSHDQRRLAVSELVAISFWHYRWCGPTKIWDIASREAVVELQMEPNERVAELQFSADDSLIVGTIWEAAYTKRWAPTRTAVWNAKTGESLWSRDYTELVQVENQAAVLRTWERGISKLYRVSLETNETLETLLDGFPHYTGTYAPEQGLCIDTVKGPHLVLRDLKRGQVRKLFGDDLYKVPQRRSSQPNACFHPDFGSLAAGATDGSVRLWNTTDDRLKRILRGHRSEVLAAEFSHDGRWLATGDWNGEVRLWQPDEPTHHLVCKKGVSRVKGDDLPTSEAVAFRWSGAGVVRFQNNRLQTWDANSGIELQYVESTDKVLIGDRRRQACFDAAGERLLLPGENNTIKLLGVDTQEVIWRSQRFDSAAVTLAISADGKSVASSHLGSDSGTELRVFSIETGDSWNHEITDASVPLIALDANAKQLAVAVRTDGPTSELRVFEPGSDKFVSSRLDEIDLASHLWAIEFSPDGERLAMTTELGGVTIVDAKTLSVQAQGVGIGGIQSLAWHPSGTRLAGANREKVVVWDEHLREVITLSGSARAGDLAFEPSVAFSPDGEKLAATHWTNDVNVWFAHRFGSTTTSSRRTTRSQHAIREMERIVKSDPSNPMYKLARGQLRSQLGDVTKAGEDYRAAKKALAGDQGCLLLSGGAHVEAPPIPFHEFDGYTIEVWVSHWVLNPVKPDGAPIASQHPKFPWITEYSDTVRCNNFERLGFHLPVVSSPVVKSQEWNHFAIVDDGKTFRVFINGTSHANGEPILEQKSRLKELIEDKGFEIRVPKDQPFLIGRSQLAPTIAPRGLIRSLRVSNEPIYHDDFEPPTQLDPNGKSELVLDFATDGEQLEITDRSGNERHAKLRNAWWVNLGEPRDTRAQPAD